MLSWLRTCWTERVSYEGGLSLLWMDGLLLIPLISVFVPLSVEAAIIDLDHWRHFYLVAGLIWGVTAGYRTTKKGEEARLSALV